MNDRGERLLRLRDVEAKTSLGRSTIYRYIKEGRFPKGLQLGPATVRWREAEVDDYILTLQAAGR